MESEPTIKTISHSGRLDTNTSADLDLALQPLLESGQFIILDLSQCPYMSSIGIRVLLKTKKKLLTKQGDLYLTGLVPAVFQVIEMAGLHNIFQIKESPEAARKAIRTIQENSMGTMTCVSEGISYVYHPLNGKVQPALLWKDDGIASYNELGFSIGFGAPAESGVDDQEQSGLFVTTGHCAGFIPDDPHHAADFRVSPEPEKAGIILKEALSFGRQPSGLLRMKEPGRVSFQQLADASETLKKQLSPEKTGWMLMVAVNPNPAEPTISMILPAGKPLHDFTRMEDFQKWFSANENNGHLPGIVFSLSELQNADAEKPLVQLLNENLIIENIVDIQPLQKQENLENPWAWVFFSNDLSDAKAHRLVIETDPKMIFEPYKAFLVRRLYTDSAKVKVDPLHGGYTAQTYQVTSYDAEGRKMRPTVLKVANRAMITRESERCRQYALPYIFNNSAVVLGAEFYGETGALRYNFVGIGGEAAQLKWLTHYYNNAEMELLEPLFDKIFLQILKPWYGQPVRKIIFPFRDHDPTFTFFPYIYQTVGELFSISADEKYITVEEFDQPILNPYWFLKHEFARRCDEGMDYFTGICHGDLNMQNILLDEKMNVYLIDFSETKPRSVISDFARLEAIFLVDNAPVDNEADIKDYLQFITRLYDVEHLNETPMANYAGRHREKVAKSTALTLKMRKYAFDCAQQNPDPIPYYLALLEWVLPVVCYGLPIPQRRVSMIVSSILCRKVMDAENGKTAE